MTFHKGYRPDPEVVRQRRPKFHLLKAARGLGAAPLPLSTNNRQYLLPSAGGPGILNQFQTSSCEGHAHASGITLRFAIELQPIPLASPICLYDGARILSRQPNPDGSLPALTDDGTEPSQILQAAQQFGVCSAVTWGNYPADPSTINNEPTPQQLAAAREFEIDGAYFLTSTGDQFCTDIMTALASGYVCSSAIAASSSSFENYTGGVLGALDSDVDHASLWVDYEWDGANLSSLVFWGVNSWGTSWGTSGVSGIAGGMYQFNREFAGAYSQDCAALSVVPLGGHEV